MDARRGRRLVVVVVVVVVVVAAVPVVFLAVPAVLLVVPHAGGKVATCGNSCGLTQLGLTSAMIRLHALQLQWGNVIACIYCLILGHRARGDMLSRVHHIFPGCLTCSVNSKHWVRGVLNVRHELVSLYTGFSGGEQAGSAVALLHCLCMPRASRNFTRPYARTGTLAHTHTHSHTLGHTLTGLLVRPAVCQGSSSCSACFPWAVYCML